MEEYARVKQTPWPIHGNSGRASQKISLSCYRLLSLRTMKKELYNHVFVYVYRIEQDDGCSLFPFALLWIKREDTIKNIP